MATRETWAARVREWKRSGLTAAEFAERQGLNARTLTWWSSQLGRSALAISQPPVVEVMVTPRADVASSLEVVLASGIRVAVPVGFDEATLGRLLTVLEDR
jgi:transposase